MHPNHLQPNLRPVPPGGPPQRSAAMAQRLDSHSRTPGIRRRRNRLDREEGADGTELPGPSPTTQRRASSAGRREKGGNGSGKGSRKLGRGRSQDKKVRMQSRKGTKLEVSQRDFSKQRRQIKIEIIKMEKIKSEKSEKHPPPAACHVALPQQPPWAPAAACLVALPRPLQLVPAESREKRREKQTKKEWSRGGTVYPTPRPRT